MAHTHGPSRSPTLQDTAQCTCKSQRHGPNDRTRRTLYPHATTRSHAVLARATPRHNGTTPRRCHTRTVPRDRTSSHGRLRYSCKSQRNAPQDHTLRTIHPRAITPCSVRSQCRVGTTHDPHDGIHTQRDAAPHDHAWRSRGPRLNRTAPSGRAGVQQERGLGVQERL